MLELQHVQARAQSEKDFFSNYLAIIGHTVAMDL